MHKDRPTHTHTHTLFHESCVGLVTELALISSSHHISARELSLHSICSSDRMTRALSLSLSLSLSFPLSHCVWLYLSLSLFFSVSPLSFSLCSPPPSLTLCFLMFLPLFHSLAFSLSLSLCSLHY